MIVDFINYTNKIYLKNDKQESFENLKLKIEKLNKNIVVEYEVYKIIGGRNRRYLGCYCKLDGYKWESSTTHLLNGHGCKKCSGKLKYSLEEVFKIVKDKGYIPLFDDYKNANSLLKIQDDNGYIGYLTLTALMSNVKLQPFFNRNKYTIQNIHTWCKNTDSNMLLLSCEYVGSHDLMLWRCKKHNIEFYASWDNILSGNECYLCGKEKVSNENHYRWKGGISTLSRYLRAKEYSWNESIKKEFGNICDITGTTDNIIVHHLISFNILVEEVLKTLNLSYDYGALVKDFTSEDLKSIESLYIKTLKSKGKGVCLSVEEHKEFHRVYGYGYNTPEQYYEFKNNRLKELRGE